MELERYRGGDIEVVLEVGDMEKHGVSSLDLNVSYRHFHRERAKDAGGQPR
jgi:hypothetical protein